MKREYVISAHKRCVLTEWDERGYRTDTYAFVPVLSWQDGCYEFWTDHQPTMVEALRLASERREQWQERDSKRVVFVRVDGEIGDVVRDYEQDDAPSMTGWQRDVADQREHEDAYGV